jgi:hypothetical protein
MMGMGINCSGAILEIQFDQDQGNQWLYVGPYVHSFVTTFQSVPSNKFSRFRFRKRGSSIGAAPIFGTIEITSWEDEGFYYQ